MSSPDRPPFLPGASAEGQTARLRQDLISKPMAAQRRVELLLVGANAPRIADQIRRIVAQPLYRQAGPAASLEKEAPPLVIGTSLDVHVDVGEAPLSWPLRFVAPAALLPMFGASDAVRRGMAVVEPYGAAPGRRRGARILTDVVKMREAAYPGSALAMRFADPYAMVKPLPRHLTFDVLASGGPCVILPLGGGAGPAHLDAFVAEVASNQPYDAAAWAAAKMNRGRTRAPVVMAPTAFLDRARLYSIVPHLRERLRGLPRWASVTFPAAAFPLLGLSSDLAGIYGGHFRPDQVEALLALASSIDWDTNAAGILLAIVRGIEAAEAAVREDGSRQQPRQRPQVSTSIDFGTVTWPKADWPAALVRPSDGEGALPGDEVVARLEGGDLEFVPPSAAAAAAGPPDDPARYTDVRLLAAERDVAANEPLLAGRLYTLDVAIRGNRIGLTRDRADQAPVDIPSQTSTVTVWVVVCDESPAEGDGPPNAFVLGQRFAKFRLPQRGDSEGSATFKLTPREAAVGRRGRIGIRLYHKLSLIDHLELDATIVSTADATRHADALTVACKHPKDAAGLETLSADAAARALTISISRADAESYRFAFVAGRQESPGVPALAGTRKLSETALNDFAARFRDILLDTVFGPGLDTLDISPRARDDLLLELAKLGSTIVARLFYLRPDDELAQIGQMLRDVLDDTSIIQIALSKDAKDFVFPWQSLVVDPAFDEDAGVDALNLWGHRFIIEVKRCADGADARDRAAAAVRPRRITYARGNFINEPAHHDRLKTIVSAAAEPTTLVDPPVETGTALFRALRAGGGDLLYVYAHGHSAVPLTPSGQKLREAARLRIDAIDRELAVSIKLSEDEKQKKRDYLRRFVDATRFGADSALMLAKTPVTLTDLFNHLIGADGDLADAPIVFLNTCESAQVWTAIEDSFVGFFLDRGARAVLGSETSIPIVFADAFGLAALQALLAGATLGEAVFKARRTLLEEARNPLGLCYTIYGAADVRMGTN